jgi:uncharacterized protein (TIGR02453 family)
MKGMKVGNQIEFSGFPMEALDFFKELAKKNNREWFQEHKHQYREMIQYPARAFTLALGESLKLLSSGLEYDLRLNGMGSVLRIYRDIRFSKDKTPYKTHLGIIFWEGSRKKMENPGFYFQLASSGAEFYCGHYQFPRDYLRAFREAVDDPATGSELESILEDLKENTGFEVGGERYKRVPTGYDAEHPRANLLLYKGLWVKSPFIDPKEVIHPDLVDVCFHYAVRMIPLHKWLVDIDKFLLS